MYRADFGVKKNDFSEILIQRSWFGKKFKIKSN